MRCAGRGQLRGNLALVPMKFTERAIVFECAGDELVGVIAEPESPGAIAVLVVVGGPQYRVGSHRQFVLLARQLASAGFPVMRFDCRGMGDGSGAARTFEEINVDIAAAIDQLHATGPGLGSVVLWGLCDAASAALCYWQEVQDPRIAGMVLLNPWVRSETSIAKTHIKHYYGKRLMTTDFWAKLLGGRLNAAQAIRGLARTISSAMRQTTTEKTGGRPAYQGRMALGLGSFPGPVLLILSGNDLIAKEFHEYSQSDEVWRDALNRPNVERLEVADADHTFSSERWAGEVESQTLRWLSTSVLTHAR